MFVRSTLRQLAFFLAFALLYAQAIAATRYWVGGAGPVAQVDSFTPANVEIGDVFRITIGDYTVSFTATAPMVANVTAGLAAACSASTAPAAFDEINWSDQTTFLRATSSVTGTPFTATSSATDGGGANTQTLTRAAVTASKGPEHWDDAANWDGGTLPAAGDDLVIQRTDQNIRYGLEYNAADTFASLTIESFTGSLGLANVRPSFNYKEYRPKYLKLGATTLTIASPDTSGLNSGLIRIDNSNLQTTLRVYGSSTPSEAHAMAIEWKGTHASNVVEVYRGSLGIARLKGESATVATLRVLSIDSAATDSLVVCGTGLTIANIEQTGGLLGLRSNPSGTTTLKGGALYMLGGCTSLGTLKLQGGSIRGVVPQ